MYSVSEQPTVTLRTHCVPYCLNIHRGESLSEVCENIRVHARRVKAEVSPRTIYPLGMRLSACAADELTRNPSSLERFSAMLEEEGMCVSLLNGFPYGAFHGTPVKQEVYRPDWSAPERYRYTARLCRILAALLPVGARGNVSTVPLAYRTAANRDPGELRTAYVHAVVLAALDLERLEQETGREITLALEPEPDCLLEDTADVLSWYENELLPEGIRWLTGSHGKRTAEEADALLRRYVGICLDTCHFAVAFERPVDALRTFAAAGIRVARIQVSSALRTVVTDETRTALCAFLDPVYLHQTKTRTPSGRRHAFPDLTDAVLKEVTDGAELRTHFHVPLFYAGDGALATTRDELTPEFLTLACGEGIPLEIETYTFDVLPEALRGGDVVDVIVKETKWIQGRIESAK
ncbi:MAG: metabolite traffic protein EboE [Kiritimatiellae bacterium]|nr:metabolite traffic protein EboE [Kiritimatiellia bacterium]